MTEHGEELRLRLGGQDRYMNRELNDSLDGYYTTWRITVVEPDGSEIDTQITNWDGKRRVATILDGREIPIPFRRLYRGV